MKATLICEASYNGLGWSDKKPIDPPREVEVLGVPSPVDPGVVAIRDGNKNRYVAAFQLEGCPPFNFGAMLNDEQIASREAVGLLFGSGVGGERKILTVEKCILYTPEEVAEQKREWEEHQRIDAACDGHASCLKSWEKKIGPWNLQSNEKAISAAIIAEYTHLKDLTPEVVRKYLDAKYG